VSGGIPFVVVDDGDDPPWGHDRTCPRCGQTDLPLQASETISATGPRALGLVLHYISHCGGTWLRGPIGRSA
jgi:hypothetical protein